MLNVDYVVSGSVQRQGRRLTVTVELAETRTARIVWTEVFNHKLDDAFVVLDEIGNRIVASIASEIETVERNRAILKPPSSLDAWEAYHRGLWHMYRFNQADNEHARHFFEMAVRLDPTFARAYAGLSFTHFQNAFLGWDEREPEIEHAFEPPGRASWPTTATRRRTGRWGARSGCAAARTQSLIELERAIDLSPNFALGHYTLAFVHSPVAAIRRRPSRRPITRASSSPFDPLLFAMLGARAMALVRLERVRRGRGLGASRRPRARTRMRTSWRSPPTAWRWRIGSTRRRALVAVDPQDPSQATASTISSPRSASVPDGTALFSKGAKSIGI